MSPLNPDGSVFHRGTTVLSGFLLKLHGRILWVTAGHCLKGELDQRIERGELRITGGGFLDYFGHEAKHFHMYPFTYEPGCAWYVEEPEHGLDFALLLLDSLQEQAFAANKLIPISRENWIHQPRLTFDFYRMLGVPADQVHSALKNGWADLNVRQAMVAINRIAVDEVGEPPPGINVPADDWFIGRIDPGAEIQDIKGMSGGPIYGFRRDSNGQLTYHAVALQSRWWDVSRTVFGCSLPYFAEAVYRQIEAFIQEIEDVENV